MRGETRGMCLKAGVDRYFNPLPSCEGRRVKPMIWRVGSLFQSTPLMRGETKLGLAKDYALRISIHSPHARGDLHGTPFSHVGIPFQSTPLMRGETRDQGRAAGRADHFNPLPSCEGRLRAARNSRLNQNFNPLPSCEGRLTIAGCGHGVFVFQSTPLMRGETMDSRRKNGAVKFQSTPLMRGETL